jgi:hypothetical protein
MRGPMALLLVSTLTFSLLYAPAWNAPAVAEEVKTPSPRPHESLSKERVDDDSLAAPSFHTALPRSLQWVGEGAWHPPKGEWYVGLWDLRYSPLSWLTLSTWTTPWIFGGVNLGGRISLLTRRDWSLGVSAHLMRINLGRLIEENTDSKGEGEAFLMISPVALYGSYRVTDRLVMGAEIKLTAVSAAGAGGEENKIQGATVTTNTNLRLHAGWAFNDRWSLWWAYTRLLSQDLQADTSSELNFDGGVKLEIFAQLDSDQLNFVGSSAHQIKLLYRDEIFTTSLGFATGTPPIYLISSVSPSVTFLPYLDVGWRW